MKVPYILTLSILSFLSCSKPQEVKVEQPPKYTCGNDFSFRKDTTLQKIDTTDNTYTKNDTLGSDDPLRPAARADIRVYEKSGNFYVFTLRDYDTRDGAPASGFYQPIGNKKLSVRYFLPGFKPSNFVIDSASMNFTQETTSVPYKISGTFGARMIDTAHHDTIRLKKGEFKSLCIEFSN